MPQMISLGPISLDGHLLVYALAIIAGYWAMKLRFIYERDDEVTVEMQSIMDVTLTAVNIVALFWKFGTVLFKPSLLWENPMRILLMRGTMLHTSLGIAVALIYAMFKLKRLNVRFMRFADGVSYGVLTGFIVHALLIKQYGRPTSLPWGISLNDPSLQYHPIHVYVLLLCLGVYVFLWTRRFQLGKGKVMQYFLTYVGLGLWAISMLDFGAGVVLFNGMQRVYAAMVVLGYVFPHIIRWKGVVSS